MGFMTDSIRLRLLVHRTCNSITDCRENFRSTRKNYVGLAQYNIQIQCTFHSTEVKGQCHEVTCDTLFTIWVTNIGIYPFILQTS